MSSTYRVLCLSHDPAIVATAIDSPEQAEQAEQAIRDGVDGHESCDLMIGRYSYPLVELGCPGHSMHSHTTWADVAWVRLLAYAQQQPEGSALRDAAGASALACFSPERLRRLRDQLGTVAS